jgi:polysaccharide deacetylase 2 family uncharacterized protein YibQ
MWLWSPDRTLQTAEVTPPPTAPPDVPARHAPLPTAAPVATAPPATAPPPTAPPPAATPVAVVTEEASEKPVVAQTPAPGTPSPVALLATHAPVVSRAPAKGARLAIIIDDCGQWPVTERAFVALPFPVTLSVLPHVRFGSAIARDASAAGQGVMLHLPMQTISGEYPGPGTITTTMSDAAIRNEVASDLAELPQARGVNNHEGSLATQDTRVMTDIADVLAQDGRYFIDSRTSSASVGESVAHEHGVLTASRSVFLDNVDSEPAVEARLLEALSDARATGSAIAIGHPRAATLAAVRTVAPLAAADGVELTLASALVH